MTRLALVVSLSLSLVAFAQEPSSSAGKQALSAVTKGLDKLGTLDPVKSTNAFQGEIDKVKKKLEALKKAEPTLDVSAHEKRLADFEQVLAQGKADKAGAKDARAKEIAAVQAKDQADADAKLARREAAGAEKTAPAPEPTPEAAPTTAPDKAANEKAEAEALAKVKLKPAVRSDASLEAQFKKALEAEGWNEQVLAVNLLDTDWHVAKNQVTGAVTHRYQTAAMKTKNQAGKCLAYEFTMKQDFSGGKFQDVGRRLSHDSTYMLCEK